MKKADIFQRHYWFPRDLSCFERNLLQPIRSFTQICEVTRHQYGISKLVPRSHFAKKVVMASRYALLFSQAILPKFLEDHAKK